MIIGNENSSCLEEFRVLLEHFLHHGPLLRALLMIMNCLTIRDRISGLRLFLHNPTNTLCADYQDIC